MLKEDVRPTTQAGVKRLANTIKKRDGIQHSVALDHAAKAAGCENFRNAQKILPTGKTSRQSYYVLLTIYWWDAKKREGGRETSRVALSRSILDICPKAKLKYVRGFDNLRMVADDHFICDDLVSSQEYAQDRICTAERSLRFMEYTGLQPFRGHGKPAETLPNTDHSTSWIEPVSRQFVLIDEPYSGVPDEAARSDWAKRNGWEIRKVAWAGMYFPSECDLYVAIQQGKHCRIDDVVAKVDAIPDPVTVDCWNGESSPSWDIFLSPKAKTKQDRRRARCMGMIYPEASAATVPYRYSMGCARRRPKGALGIEGHITAGRIIKAALSSRHGNSASDRRLNSLRCELENWLDLEIQKGELDDANFFAVYYTETEEDGKRCGRGMGFSGFADVRSDLSVATD